MQVSGSGFPSVDEIGIVVRAKTSSGNTELKSVGSFCNSSSCGGNRMAAASNNQIKVFPNPASTQVTVTLQNNLLAVSNEKENDNEKNKIKPVIKDASKKVITNTKANTNVINEITQIKVVNSMGFVKKVLRFAKGNKTVNFAVNDLKEGIYILELTDGKLTTKSTLIIRR